MPRTRPSTDPISFHKATGQFYVTRGGSRLYLGADRDAAIERYHRLELGLAEVPKQVCTGPLSAKELANRFIASQQANWRNPETTLKGYSDWLKRFLEDHPRLQAEEFSVEMFAAWKLSLRQREYAPVSINHFLNAVRAIFNFAEEVDLLPRAPRLSRVKNENRPRPEEAERPLYTTTQIQQLVQAARPQMRMMILLGLNCGFGPKDLQDLTWGHFRGERVTLSRSKTGVRQTFLLWPQTKNTLDELRTARVKLVARLARRGRPRSDGGHVFMTKYWRPWCKDAISLGFRQLCVKVGVPCYGFYRLRHCASTAMASVASPHVKRKFMRHTQVQQQVTYTHLADAEVDEAIQKTRVKLLGDANEGGQKSPGQEDAA